MNALELELDYPFGEALPEPGHTLEVAPGVRWIRMALPFALNHINLWLLADELDGVKGWTVVDCCITSDDAKALWEQIFATQLQGIPILRVLVTHMHPDHVGLAHWLCERWNAPLWMSATDYYAARLGSQSTTGFGGPDAAGFFCRPRAARPRRGGQDTGPHAVLPQHGAGHAQPIPPPHGRGHGAHRGP